MTQMGPNNFSPREFISRYRLARKVEDVLVFHLLRPRKILDKPSEYVALEGNVSDCRKHVCFRSLALSRLRINKGRTRNRSEDRSAMPWDMSEASTIKKSD